MSREGVTYWAKSETQFTHLDEWESQYKLYRELMEVQLG
jgi:hypothetical protein